MPSQGGPDIEWATFDPDAIPALVSEGKTVVVSMTAQWCITCKVNDKTTWETPQVIEALSGSVVPMKGDWTKPDPRIYDFLKSHGRYGIPFTVVYAPTAPDGTVLPDVLTPSIVLSAVGID
jgi:suppressor for copper-sensitivity B